MRWVFGWWWAAAGIVTGCVPGAVGEAVRPEAPTAGDALGERPKRTDCRTVAEAAPLIVDSSSDERLELEIAMKRGVAIVRYDCDGLELLDRCSLRGGYSFVGVSRKEDVVALTSADEILVNLPLSAARLGGELERGSAFEVALVMVGKKVAAASQISRLMLDGRCDGATHFVRAATVGAFAMERGSAGKIRAVAELFGAGASATSESRRSKGSRDGDLVACRRSRSDASSPPDQCQAALRLELVPLLTAIHEEQATKTEPPATSACPDGMVETRGKCTKAEHGTAFVCAASDVEQCTAQCDAGNMPSCYNLGRLYAAGLGVAQSRDRAIELLYRACSGGEPRSCPAFAFLSDACRTAKGTACREQDVLALLLESCDAGGAESCYAAGMRTFDDTGARNGLLDRACKLGQRDACMTLGNWLLSGTEGMAKDVARGVALLHRSCDAGSISGCALLADTLKEGKNGVPTDLARATSVDETLCGLGAVNACLTAADAYDKAPAGISRDLQRAEKLYRAACSMTGSGEPAGKACFSLATMLRQRGLRQGRELSDAERNEALGAYADACRLGGYGCDVAATSARERAWAEDKRRCLDREPEACRRLELAMHESGCELKNEPTSCRALGEQDEARLRAVRLRQCRASKDAGSTACETLKQIGGRVPTFGP